MYWKVRNCFVIKSWLNLFRRGRSIRNVTQCIYLLREVSRICLYNRCFTEGTKCNLAEVYGRCARTPDALNPTPSFCNMAVGKINALTTTV